MKLYHHPISSSSRRVSLVVAHLDLQLDEQLIDLSNPTDRGALVAVNPNNKIPVLVDGDLVLWESHAIMKYLCAKTPGQKLYPSEARGQADVDRWLFWVSAHLGPHVGSICFERLWKGMIGAGDADPAVVARHEGFFHQASKVLEQHLVGREFVVGDAPTLADYSLAPTLMYAERARLPMDPYPNIRAHRARVMRLPAWHATEPR